MAEAPPRRKEIYTYEAPWTVFASAWSQRLEPQYAFRLAIGSFLEEYSNKVQVIQRMEDSQHFSLIGEVDHSYPPTKIMFSPQASGVSRDLMATTGDYLRLWKIDSSNPLNPVTMEALLNNTKNSEYCSPLTSFDWNEVDPSILGTSSIDTTCTIWDLAAEQARTQLIAHDKAVYDIAWARGGRDVFASVGGDGSVRMFDLRSLEHSTIIYETADLTPLLRLAWNKQDPNYLAAILTDSSMTVIVDIRVPSLPVAELGGHEAPVNTMAWAPHSSCHICTGGDDSQALIWDLSGVPQPIEDPILAYSAEAEVNNLQWAASQPDW
eukprot:CAMPEP_0113938410 /NCGR_PEP_ID=MMETSP1339-20121228/4843_1 /TAXON_ID=94617 /ORGANISM="Fibrocapsa japonica" /LENGTH=322 /DNA_ID=CAMNT_0000941515 /DNA_START=50 /DNA_END=1015 /DNA_ORIENTATION=- /assembly_acc=CAM_ASM_000762